MTVSEPVLTRWSVYGNRLLLLDLRASPPPDGEGLFRMARSALERTGDDSLILIRSGTPEDLAACGLGPGCAPEGSMDAMVRILEPDGSESLSCGNGLLCVAAWLRRRGGTLPARVLTGTSSGCPWLVEVGQGRDGTPWLRHGPARRVPDGLYRPAFRESADGVADLVRDLGEGAGEGVPAGLRGYLLLTGEPHLVVLVDQGADQGADNGAGTEPGRGADWLNALGLHLNLRRRDLFPRGVNVDLVLGGGAEEGVRYRCFERGVNRETGACGTGAMAVASVWRARRAAGSAVRILPSGAPEGGGYMVRFVTDGLLLGGRPLLQAEAPMPKPERISLYSSVS